jgi:hypothetical protein
MHSAHSHPNKTLNKTLDTATATKEEKAVRHTARHAHNMRRRGKKESKSISGADFFWGGRQKEEDCSNKKKP